MTFQSTLGQRDRLCRETSRRATDARCTKSEDKFTSVWRLDDDKLLETSSWLYQRIKGTEPTLKLLKISIFFQLMSAN